MTNDPCGCNAILIPELHQKTLSRKQQLSTLLLIDQSTFERVGNSGGGAANFSISGIPIGGSANYAAFNEARSALFRQEQFNATLEEALGELSVFVSKNAIEAWSKCKSDCINASRKSANPEYGLKIWIERFDAESVTVNFRMDAPPGVPHPGRVTNSQLLNATAIENGVAEFQVFPERFELVDEIPISRTFKRSLGAPAVTLNVTTNYGTAVLHLAPFPKEREVKMLFVATGEDDTGAGTRDIPSVKARPGQFTGNLTTKLAGLNPGESVVSVTIEKHGGSWAGRKEDPSPLVLIRGVPAGRDSIELLITVPNNPEQNYPMQSFIIPFTATIAVRG